MLFSMREMGNLFYDEHRVDMWYIKIQHRSILIMDLPRVKRDQNMRKDLHP